MKTMNISTINFLINKIFIFNFKIIKINIIFNLTIIILFIRFGYKVMMLKQIQSKLDRVQEIIFEIIFGLLKEEG